ncbi:Kanadaptin [Habropoda laboriosa]|uniref:Kanadaptin n=1 Tax=Habropoda laboriosa TaxID=597456 RepID=A0A0L7RD59_9HYME|nr:PREDICTED: kanadaptin [Habropoda laboriosa]KOC68793.1 Kanadaptin [Habropoda laboriosa]
METKISVEKLARESKEHLNDGERNVQYEINDRVQFSETSDPSDTLDSDTDLTKQCTNDDSFKDDPNGIANTATFKKPTVLIGPKRSRLVRKVFETSPLTDDTQSSTNDDYYADPDVKSQKPSQDIPFPYAEPSWGGKPVEDYKIEVLKSGVIVETISLSEQSFHVIGRLPSCHVLLAHPTISRYHAVLQYRSIQDNDNLKGFYVYDLGSTHGTFWNGSRIKPNVYVRIHGGHMLRFGCSQRKYILQAPPDDQEEESRYTLTELKEMRASELGKRHIKEGDQVKAEESEGIDWGMGEDADEETDLQENPYACITDDDLVLEDPKKTLRGWFEREGYDLHYQTEEKGLGQFLCWVDIPMEDIVGHSMRAEALVKGKKKEAVVQCALEACKILDKYGLLRQANHEARKRKARNWEAEDYYDSDEDNFLDRTGSVERKREQRMRLAGKLDEKVETYDSLLEKHREVLKRISHLSTSMKNWQTANDATKKETTEEDALDAFMSSLSSYALTKSDIAKMKLELQNLRREEAGLIKLLNLTRPANLPALSSPPESTNKIIDQVKMSAHVVQETPLETKKLQGSLFRCKRVKRTNQRADANRKLPVSNTMVADATMVEAESEEEEDSDDNDGQISSSSHISSDKKVLESERSISNVAATKNESSDKNEKQRKYKVETKTKKYHRQEQQKVYCDQDVYADNYSTWVPPRDQAGDGKTSLNEKYGY